MPTLFAQQVRQLRGGRGLSRSLKPCEDDDRRWPVRARERCRGAPEHLHDGVVDDLHDLLRAGYRFEDALAGRALAHGRDELSHDLEVHVGLEEGDTHVAQRLIQIDLGDARTPPQSFERVGQAVRELLEHHTRL